MLAKDAAVADAYATALGNLVKGPDDIDAALAFAATRPEILGAVVIVGAVGQVELVPYGGGAPAFGSTTLLRARTATAT